MPLPLSNTRWPPKELDEPYLKMAEWAAWYSGEPTRLMDFYGAARPSGQQPTHSPWYRFWSRTRGLQADGLQKAVLHVPVASDLAGVSAALLFGEPPRIRIKEAHEDEQAAQQADDMERAQFQQKQAQTALDQATAGKPTAMLTPPPGAQGDPTAKPKKKAETPAQKTEARLIELIDESDFIQRVQEAADTAAGLGGVYIYPAWDKSIRDHPFVAVAQADMAVPTFRFGYLSEVIFHRVVAKDGNKVWRHLEWHYTEGESESRKAFIEQALYLGTEDGIGDRISLKSRPETAELEKEIELPFGELDVEYVPNIRPNRLWRASGLGVADIQGSETLLDALDEVYASWMRDVRLAKARIIVPAEYLDYSQDSNGKVRAAFDMDQEVYVPMDIAPSMENSAAQQMLAHQFDIRWQEHEMTATNLIHRIVSNAGYSPQTLGERPVSNQGQATASALRVTEHKTLLTLRRKGVIWSQALSRVLFRLQQIDKDEFGSGVEPIKPAVEMADSIIDNPLELAQTAMAMKSAEAASIETRVRIINPSWTDAEVASEVERIQSEVAAAKPPPIPSFGDPKADPSATGNFSNQNKGTPKSDSPPPQNPPTAKKQ